MKAPISESLAAKLPFPGLAGWVARSSDRSMAHQSYVDWLDDAQAVQAFNYSLLAAETVRQHELIPKRLNWSYEHMGLSVAIRTDGSSLALFLTKTPELESATVEDIIREFLQGAPSEPKVEQTQEG
jgi:hypothetical protein